MSVAELMVPGAISHNNVSDLPTFLCPYDYSPVRAKDKYEDLIYKSDPATNWTCSRKFPYNQEKCGTGCVD